MNKNTVLIFIICLIVLGGFVYWRSSESKQTAEQSPEESPSNLGNIQIEEITQNLDTPWGIVFLPDGTMLVTERPGRIRLVDPKVKGEAKIIKSLSQVKEIGEGGLLGIALHPNFAEENYVYIYYTYTGDDNSTLNKVVRMSYREENFGDEELIVDRIPGAPNHNGGRIKFGPDNFLYITTGDAQNPSRAQDRNSLSGKILRVTDKGEVAPGNPFGNMVYSYGHRNPQGITWDNEGRLWATEHGRSGALSGLDEVNLIEPGKNYGWPEIQGDEKQNGMETPRIHSGNDTWAPAGLAYKDNSLFFAGLRGQAFYEAVINGPNLKLKEHFKGELGRLREAVVGPDNSIYITTSNQDGRGNPHEDDDKILKINL